MKTSPEDKTCANRKGCTNLRFGTSRFCEDCLTPVWELRPPAGGLDFLR